MKILKKIVLVLLILIAIPLIAALFMKKDVILEELKPFGISDIR